MGGEFYGVIGATIPEGDGMRLPNGSAVLQHLVEFGQALSLDRRSLAARPAGRWKIKIWRRDAISDTLMIASDGGEDSDGGERGVVDDDDAAVGSQRWICNAA